MPNTATVYLPVSTWVHIRAVTNAAFTQRVTIAFEDGSRQVLVGAGEHDAPMPKGDFSITTPPKATSPLGYRIVVTVETQVGGNWQPSMVSEGECSVMYYHLAMVVSEDSVDQDWNDAVVMFSWWVPPSARSFEDLRKD